MLNLPTLFFLKYVLGIVGILFPYKRLNFYFKKHAEIMRGIESIDQFENWLPNNIGILKLMNMVFLFSSLNSLLNIYFFSIEVLELCPYIC